MRQISINLLTKRNEDSYISKFIYFSLHYLRYIVVLTQIAIISVFFYRVMIDQEIIDLEEKILEKKEIINVSKSLWNEAKKIDFVINQSKKILTSQEENINNINMIFSSVPDGLFFEYFSLSKENIHIKGKTKDIELIKNFYFNLLKKNKFKNVLIEKISKLETNYEFTINVEI